MVRLTPLRPGALELRGFSAPDQGWSNPRLPFRSAAHALDAERTFSDLPVGGLVRPLLARIVLRLPDERPPPRLLPELLAGRF
jgi:hypothetical protein